MKLVTLEYLEANRQPNIVLFTREGRTRQRTVVSDFRPYFYVPLQDKMEETYKTLDGEDVGKFYTQTPGDVTEARKLFEKTWEADVHFTTRYLIDQVPQIEKCELRVQYTDVETDMETGDLISIAVFDSYLNRVVCFVWRKDLVRGVEQEVYTFPSGYQFKASVRYYNSKMSLLDDYIKFVRETDPDILSGWFFLGFDMPQIIQQINGTKVLSSSSLSPLGKCYEPTEKKHYEDGPVCRGRILWDMLKAYAKLQPTGLPDASLEAISQKELGEGKHPLQKPISWLWKNDLKTLVMYNCFDSVLVYRLDQKCQVLELYDSRRRFVGCDWYDLFKPTFMWDNKILRNKEGKVLPTKKRIEIGQIEGAEVFDPARKGIHEWIILIDLKSLYPNIIITFNMSPETVSKDKENAYNLKNKISFKKEPIGLLPKILLEMFEERQRYKDEMKKYPFGTEEYDVWDHLQTSVKVMMNSLYGATISKGDSGLTYSNFRLASREVGSSVTFMGRETIKHVKSKLESMGYKVLYGDTDSIFLFAHNSNLDDCASEANSVVEEINRDLKKFIAESGGDSEHSFITIEAKKIYSEFIMFEKKTGKKGEVAKKRYAGKVLWNEGNRVDEPENQLDFMGIEARRSNSSELSRELQKKVLKVLLGFEDKSKIKDYIKEAKNALTKEPLDYEIIGIPQGIKDLESYKTKSKKGTKLGESPWVRGSKWSNKNLNLKFGVGDKPKLLYVKDIPNYPKTDVVCFRTNMDVPKGIVVDFETMFEKSVTAKLKQLLDAANLASDEIFLGQNKLEKFLE